MPRTEHQLSDRQIVQQEKRRFARELRAWRAGKGMTLQEASDKFGVSRGLIQAIEEGRSFPSFETLVVMCRQMGTSVPSCGGKS